MADQWTLGDIPDLSGKVMIVTGANSGIGYAAARVLAEHGAQVVLTTRDATKGRAAIAQLRRDNHSRGAAGVEMTLDLADLASVRRFADAFCARFDRLDVLLNNAGVMMIPYGQTVDGFERQFGTNHLGHFALTGRLLAPLAATPGARVVNVSSIAHRGGTLDFDRLMYPGGAGYTPVAAYRRSKLANLLFTRELQRRFQAHGIDARALAAHPGLAATNLIQPLRRGGLLAALGRPLLNLFAQNAAAGALPSLRAALDPTARGGEYFGPGGMNETRGAPVRVGMTPAAQDDQAARRLWEVSEVLTGVRYLD